MSSFDYSGYPMRSYVPHGYSFVQYVSIFRDAGGYGSLTPRQPATTSSSETSPSSETGGGKADKPGTRVAKGANKLSMPGNGKALGHIHSNGNGREGGKTPADIQSNASGQETGKFDAIEGNAKAELKWRDTPQR